MVEKSSKGRQKIEIAKIPKKNHLQVTFSKRKSGLFKKASELCTLCGANIAILVFSPGGKVFSFGHPDVRSIVHSFFAYKPPTKRSGLNLIEAHDQSASIHKLNLQLAEVLNQLEAEKKRGEILGQIRASQAQCWWEAPIDELSLFELQQLKESMEELKKIVVSQAELLLMEGNANPSTFNKVNGNPMVDDFEFERKLSEIHGLSIVPHVYNFGHGLAGFF